eukprot:1506378-Pyramimonas_sp.AAC.1
MLYVTHPGLSAGKRSRRPATLPAALGFPRVGPTEGPWFPLGQALPKALGFSRAGPTGHPRVALGHPMG